MGFPCNSYGVVMFEPLVYVLNFLDHVLLLVKLAFFYLGLFDPTGLAPPVDDHTDRAAVVNRPAPPSQPITSKLIKKSLPVVEFAAFVERSGGYKEDNQVCVVCLGCLERDHQIRELSNCSHVFHSGCLDKWVDHGQITCPMCRSKLLPEGYGRKYYMRMWVARRFSYFLG